MKKNTNILRALLLALLATSSVNAGYGRRLLTPQNVSTARSIAARAVTRQTAQPAMQTTGRFIGTTARSVARPVPAPAAGTTAPWYSRMWSALTPARQTPSRVNTQPLIARQFSTQAPRSVAQTVSRPAAQAVTRATSTATSGGARQSWGSWFKERVLPRYITQSAALIGLSAGAAVPTAALGYKLAYDENNAINKLQTAVKTDDYAGVNSALNELTRIYKKDPTSNGTVRFGQVVQRELFDKDNGQEILNQLVEHGLLEEKDIEALKKGEAVLQKMEDEGVLESRGKTWWSRLPWNRYD